MKCVKDKCGYYRSHDYQKSYRVCGLDEISSHKDSDRKCNIDKIIDEKYKYIKLLEKMQAGILKLQ